MTETGLALQVRADTSVAVSRADAEIKVLQAEAGATAVSTLGEASAGATKTLIDADQAYLDSNGSFDAVILSLLTSDSFIYRKPKDDDGSE